MIKKLSLILIYSFLGISLYDMIFNGLFERPSLNVAHFVPGAGGYPLIIRFALCILAVISVLIWSLTRQNLSNRFAKFLLALSLPAFFYYSAVGLQRYGKEYKESAYDHIVELYLSKSSIDKKAVLQALGEPLVREQQTIIEIHRDEEGWLYSYMPSSGFGWNKRVLYFNSDGMLSNYNRMDEP